MNISFRIRRKRMVAVGVLALTLGGLAAVLPARVALGAVGTAVVTDSVTTGNVTGPDTIVKCATSQIAIGGTQAVAVPVACLTEDNGEWVKVSWSGTGVSTELIQQTDGNFVLYAGNGKKWGAATRFVDNNGGPGCQANFQGDANLVVRDCNGTAIWASATHTFPNAVLAFQADGNLIIYSSTSGTALWSTKTS